MMIKTTKTNDYLHINTGSSNSPEGSTLLMDNKVLQDFNNEYEQITCGQIKFFKFSGEIAELEEEEDVENSTSTDQVDDIDEDEEDEERDLTNLTWLTELRNQTMGFVHMALDEESKKDNELTTISVEQISIQQPSYHYCQQPEKEITEKLNINILGQQNQRLIIKIPEHKSDEIRTTKTLNQPKRPLPAERYDMFLNKIKRDLEIYEKSAINFQSDIVEKPPFNYSHIIGMAMLENGRRITLQQICSWIERKFAFFRVRKKWNNSIRHNLSLHPCFRKIGRNKEDKGKGGYWELGVDLKKCERRRIRNRKSSAQPFKMQKKHLQTHFVKLSRRKQQNMGSVKKNNFKHCNENLKNIYAENEELLLDEMDVQQNVDVTSTHSNSHTNINSIDTSYKHSELHIGLPQINPMIKVTNKTVGEAAMLENFINNDDTIHLQENSDFKVLKKNSHLDRDICNCNEEPSDQSCQHQQHKLGTIIISATSVCADMPNIQNISQRSLNSLQINNSTKQLLTEPQPCPNRTRYTDVAHVPQNKNVTISSYVSILSDGLTNCAQESKTNKKNYNFTSSPNSTTMDLSAFPTQTIQPRPNVIVEQLIEPSSSYSTIEISSDCLPSLSSFNSSSTTMCTIESQNEDYANELVNENFRPYIDGIDEAFQYLRSIDSTRNEDILDNLLDISVNDY